MHVDHVVVAVPVGTPYRVQQLLAGEDPARFGGEFGQQVELDFRQVRSWPSRRTARAFGSMDSPANSRASVGAAARGRRRMAPIRAASPGPKKAWSRSRRPHGQANYAVDLIRAPVTMIT